MSKPKLIRITTVPNSLRGLLKNQLNYMSSFYEVIAVSTPGKILQEVEENEKVRTHGVLMTRKISPVSDMKALIQLIKFLRAEKPQIVHTHTPKAGLLGMMAAWIARVPVRLHTVAGMPLMETTGLKKQVLLLLEKLTYACATKIYPNSYGLEEYILKNRLASDRKVKVLGKGSSNGIDLNDFNPEDITVERAVSECPTIGKLIDITKFNYIFIGRLVKDKGVNELITAFVKLSQEIPELNLIILGAFEDDLDPIDAETRRHIHGHPQIHYMGYQRNVTPFLKISNALILPSYREGLPNVLMQAGAFNLPVICTNIIGCTDVIQDRANGLLVSPKSSEELYSAMFELYNNKQLYNSLRARARKFIAERYDRKFVWNSIQQEYKQLLENV